MEQQYAINLVAFLNSSRMINHFPLYLLLKNIVTKTVVHPYPNRAGHTALLVKEDINQEQWQAIFTIIRLKLSKRDFQLYEKRGRWQVI